MRRALLDLSESTDGNVVPEMPNDWSLTDIYRHVLKQSSSPERAKIAISEARTNGRLALYCERFERKVKTGLGARRRADAGDWRASRRVTPGRPPRAIHCPYDALFRNSAMT